ncbi:MAG: OmpA family protein [Alphaproteobacteria bacterium]
MNQKPEKSGRRGQRRPFLGLLSVLIGAGVLAGCSSVPDAINPVEWYRDTRDWVTGADGPAEPSPAIKPSTAGAKDFPSLNTVPSRPQPPTEAERKRLSRSLAADRQEARYSDEVIRRQTDSSGKLTQSGPVKPAATPTPPRAVQSARATPPPASAAMQTAPSAMQPPPMPRPVVPMTPIAPPADSPSFAPSAPFPPMPDAPPAPLQMGIPVPPLPSVAPAPLPLPQAGMSAPLVQRPAPVRTPAMALALPQSSPAVSGNLTFGAVPADIALNSVRPAARPVQRMSPRGGGQRFVPAQRFSSSFPAGTGMIPQPYALATGQPLATVRFAVGSARVGKSARAALRRVALTIKRNRVRVRVVGHASSRTRDLDPMSHQLANFRVSLDRANAVARELIRRGVNPDAISVDAVSDTQPAFIEVMPAGEAANRRVTILIVN